MTGSSICSTPGRQRLLFLMAGTMTLISVVLTLLVDSRWSLLAAFVAINQLTFAVFGACPASLILGRVCRPSVEQTA